jgi:hypothetical protein
VTVRLVSDGPQMVRAETSGRRGSRRPGRLLMIVKSAHVYETERGYLRAVLEEYR